MEKHAITVATWNTQWSPVGGKRGPLVRGRLVDFDADILVVTEGQRGLLPEGGFIADAGDDWGYAAPADRRKTILWSRWPLTDVVRLDSGAGKGRVVLASVEGPSGHLNLLGVCIPWASAHVATGRRDAKTWSEHLECCDQLEELATGLDPRVPIVVAGDFNERIPRYRQPLRVSVRLAQVMSRWTIHTSGDTADRPLIDHIASSLPCTGITTWPRTAGSVNLSDHAAVRCELTTVPARR
nr:endonuclease/exonuclease/phosphatase family protein [Rhodococcus sp. (in: high G+C Gram-positive bacteria)]